MIKAVADLNLAFKRTSDPRILLEMTLMKLLKMESSVNLAEVLDKLNLLEGRQSGCINSNSSTGSAGSRTEPHRHTETKRSLKMEKKEERSTPPSSQQNSSAATEEFSITDVQRGWDNVLGKIKKTKLSLWSLLKEGQIMDLEDDTLTVEFFNGRNFHKKQAERKENFNLIQKTLGEVFEQPLKLRFELNEDKMPSPDEPGGSKSHAGHNDAAKDPLVKSIMDTFEGEII